MKNERGVVRRGRWAASFRWTSSSSGRTPSAPAYPMAVDAASLLTTHIKAARFRAR